MAATRSDSFSISRPMSWAASIVAFVAAAALQIAIFGLVVPRGGLTNVSGPIALVIAAAWLVVPVLFATLLAIRKFRLIGREPGQRTTSGLFAILLFPLGSAYLGVVVSFNVWGGK
jgi:hypothetical protein